jgi:hypothetical protein
MELPNEISNIICSYIEGPTNKIMRELYFDPIYCLKLNKMYNFKHIHIPRLLEAIHKCCPHCLNRLNPEEYLYKGLYEECLNKRLCFECLKKENFRISFELCEMIFILLILTTTFSFLFYIIIILSIVIILR